MLINTTQPGETKMSKTTTTTLATDILRQIAEDNGYEILGEAAATLARALQEINGIRTRYDDADDTAAKAARLNEALGYLAGSVLPNLRLDRIADAQAALTRLPK
jgi:hypothetical protein